MEKQSILNEFYGAKIDMEDLDIILEGLIGQSICVEILKNISTMQIYNEFNYEIYKNNLYLEDLYDEEISQIRFNLNDIAEIIEGREILQAHWLIKLKCEIEVMIYSLN